MAGELQQYNASHISGKRTRNFGIRRSTLEPTLSSSLFTLNVMLIDIITKNIEKNKSLELFIEIKPIYIK